MFRVHDLGLVPKYLHALKMQRLKLDSAMKIIAKYEENLRRANIDNTPVARAGEGPPHQSAALEATPMPQSRALRRALNGSEDKDEEPAESEATNQNYVMEEGEEGEVEVEGMLTDDYIDTNSVKVAAKAGEKRKQEQRRMIKEIDREVQDSESGEDAGQHNCQEPHPKGRGRGDELEAR